jgi:hypothetical protein
MCQVDTTSYSGSAAANRGDPVQPVRAHERRGQAEDEAIDGSEIGRPLPGAITDEQLVLEQQGLGGDRADATRAKELREGGQQADGKDEDFTHRANRTITAGTCKTALRVRIASNYEFATHTGVDDFEDSGSAALASSVAAISRPALRSPSINCSTSSGWIHFPCSCRATLP